MKHWNQHRAMFEVGMAEETDVDQMASISA